MRGWLGLSLLLVACGSSAPTQATALELPAVTQARWPACTLAGWTLRESPTRFTPPAWTWCGVTYCTGDVRGYTNTTTRTIVVWAQDPQVEAVRAWEFCNACKWEVTRVLEDRGCA